MSTLTIDGIKIATLTIEDVEFARSYRKAWAALFKIGEEVEDDFGNCLCEGRALSPKQVKRAKKIIKLLEKLNEAD